MQFKGDIEIKRTGVFDRRADQGLLASAISGALALTRHSARWQDITATGAQDVTLPDATTLPNGWEVVINAETGGNLTVQDGSMSPSTIKVITAGINEAYLFTLIDNGSAAGVWYVSTLDNAGNIVASRYTLPYNATSDWGSPAGGYYTITTTAVTHGRGIYPTIQFYENIGAGVLIETTPDQSKVAANGDSSFRVPQSPDLRYAGVAIFV